MSIKFFSDVSVFFNLLDLDGNGSVTRLEAIIGMNYCFYDVHKDKIADLSSDPSESQSQRNEIVQTQVNWLFSAAGSSDSINSTQFADCYRGLLNNAYEEEVLQIDLTRAITSLQNNQEYQLMINLFGLVKKYHKSSDSNNEKLKLLFNSILGKSKSLGPKKQKLARNIVNELFSSSNSITLQQLNDCYLKLLVAEVPVQELVQDIQLVEKSGSDSNNNSSSSNSNSNNNTSSSNESDKKTA